jgi:hypothetical protein
MPPQSSSTASPASPRTRPALRPSPRDPTGLAIAKRPGPPRHRRPGTRPALRSSPRGMARFTKVLPWLIPLRGIRVAAYLLVERVWVKSRTCSIPKGREALLTHTLSTSTITQRRPRTTVPHHSTPQVDQPCHDHPATTPSLPRAPCNHTRSRHEQASRKPNMAVATRPGRASPAITPPPPAAPPISTAALSVELVHDQVG